MTRSLLLSLLMKTEKYSFHAIAVEQTYQKIAKQNILNAKGFAVQFYQLVR